MSSNKTKSKDKNYDKMEVKIVKSRRKRVTKKEKEEEKLKQIKQLNIWNYEYLSWQDKFKDDKVVLKDLYLGSWSKVIGKLMEDKRMTETETFLSNVLKQARKLNVQLYPYPDLLFNAFRLTSYRRVKVVIIGQDPYFNEDYVDGKLVPQAMGLSFSVPVGTKIPSSLNSIYKNMVKYKHLHKKPLHGNLTFWANQGVLMINSELTVQAKIANSHQGRWKWFTKKIIKHLSKEFEHLVFIMWGKFAMELVWPLVDEKKHKCIITSHPSGLSCNRGFGMFPAFMKHDTFGETNEYLKKHKKGEIIWHI